MQEVTRQVSGLRETGGVDVDCIYMAE